MPKFNIKKYLYSLPENTTNIDISCKGVYELPDISRFINLQYLTCNDNYLISLPTLPESLIYLCCERNNIRSLPLTLPANLQYLYCSYNPLHSLPPTLPPNLLHLYCVCIKLTSLPPTLPPNLLHLYCCDNRLTSLPPTLPPNLTNLHCEHNILTSMPTLPESITSFGYCFNPIWKNQLRIIHNHSATNNDVLITINQINTLNSFRYLYYFLKLRNWLWEKVLRPKIEKKYHPTNLIKNLDENTDLDAFLDHWVSGTY